MPEIRFRAKKLKVALATGDSSGVHDFSHIRIDSSGFMEACDSKLMLRCHFDPVEGMPKSVLIPKWVVAGISAMTDDSSYIKLILKPSGDFSFCIPAGEFVFKHTDARPHPSLGCIMDNIVSEAKGNPSLSINVTTLCKLADTLKAIGCKSVRFTPSGKAVSKLLELVPLLPQKDLMQEPSPIRLRLR
jgi:hypothetical protein